MDDHVLGNRDPAAVISVSAIAGVARSVEIFATVFAGDADVFLALRNGAQADVALGAGIAAQQVDFRHKQRRSTRKSDHLQGSPLSAPSAAPSLGVGQCGSPQRGVNLRLLGPTLKPPPSMAPAPVRSRQRSDR